MRERWLTSMTKRTRALFDAYQAAEAEDQAAGRSSWDEVDEGGAISH